MAARKIIVVRRSKLSTRELFYIIQCFCSSAPLKWAAQYAGISERTTRGYYLHLREIISGPEFNIWHSLALLNAASSNTRPIFDQIKEYFPACFFNELCKRNFDLGNRKKRLCRGCPVRQFVPDFPDVLRMVEYFVFHQDKVRNYYRRLGIREKGGPDPLRTMYLQTLHYEVAMTVARNSKKTAAQLIDIDQRSHLSGGLLMYGLVLELIWRVNSTNPRK